MVFYFPDSFAMNRWRTSGKHPKTIVPFSRHKGWHPHSYRLATERFLPCHRFYPLVSMLYSPSWKRKFRTTFHLYCKQSNHPSFRKGKLVLCPDDSGTSSGVQESNLLILSLWGWARLRTVGFHTSCPTNLPPARASTPNRTEVSCLQDSDVHQ